MNLSSIDPEEQSTRAAHQADEKATEGRSAPRHEPDRKESHFILWSVVLGLACGLVLGEYSRSLSWIGEAYIKLLQMTVLPYITISLILGFGSLTPSDAGRVARRGGALLLVFWAIALAAVLVVPLSFPHWQSAAFYSSSVIEQPVPTNPLELFIPFNPFHSLAEGIVPAVVVFSALIGVSLMRVKEKAGILRALSVASETVGRVIRFVGWLMPIGLFAIVASMIGTMGVEEVGRLHVYLVSYAVAALFLTFWVLPVLLTVTTPFRYREVLGVSRDAMIAALVTGNLFAIIAILTTHSKELFDRRGLLSGSTESFVDVIMPVAFNLPNAGSLLLILFIPFAAWFSGAPVAAGHYPGLAFTGLMASFGSPTPPMTYLLNAHRLSHDLVQLYVLAQLVTGRLATLLGAMHLLVFTVLSVALLTGVATVRRLKLVSYCGLTLFLMAATVGGLRVYFATFVKNTYSMRDVVAGMHLLHEPQAAQVFSSPPPALVHDPGKSHLQEIQERGFIRVGYLRDRMPYAFNNERGQLVGFDIEMAYDLARVLKATLEFVPIDRDRLISEVNAGNCDILMSGIAVTPQRAAALSLSVSYRSETVALVVPDYRRKEFLSRAAVGEMKGLRLGILREEFYTAMVRDALPRADLVELSSATEFFSPPAGQSSEDRVEAFLFTAESGSAWTLLHPEFDVVVPRPGLQSLSLAYAVARGDQDFIDFVNAWIDIKQKDGTVAQLYDYWILGKGAVKQAPHWSVLRNVLHWVE